MCGITGIYNYTSLDPVNKNSLKIATTALEHRGPDEEGY